MSDTLGNLYGVSSGSGAWGVGALFKIDASTGSLTTLYSFSGADGSTPGSGLVADTHGNLFGSTSAGGANGDGTIFEFNQPTDSLTVLANFDSSTGAPVGGLLMDGAGNLFGTDANGQVFELASGASNVTTLAQLSGAASFVGGVVADTSGNLYAATVSTSDNTAGSVVELSNSGFVVPSDPGPTANSGSYTVGHGQAVDITKSLYSYITPGLPGDSETIVAVTGNAVLNADGSVTYHAPNSGATDSFSYTVRDEHGQISTGTMNVTIDPGPQVTVQGPSYPLDHGTTISLGMLQTTITPGLPGDSVTITYGGAGVNSALNLYTAPATGSTSSIAYTATDQYGDTTTGTINVALANHTPVTTTIASLANTSISTITYDNANGMIYGVTTGDGANGDGTLFEMNPVTGSLTTLASFSQNIAAPSQFQKLTIDAQGNVFGTSWNTMAWDNASNQDITTAYGTVFDYNAATGVLAAVPGVAQDNALNYGDGLVADAQGNLYGTTLNGGDNNDGTVFEIDHLTGSLTTLASFNGADGTAPEAQLLVDSQGNIYGTTNGSSLSGNPSVVFEINRNTDSISTIATLDPQTVGFAPSNLVLAANGDLIGLTGAAPSSAGSNYFEVNPSTGSVTVLGTSQGQPGPDPYLASDGRGTMALGGPYSTLQTFSLGTDTTTVAVDLQNNGASPYNSSGGYTADSQGNLYGVSGYSTSSVVNGTVVFTPQSVIYKVSGTGFLGNAAPATPNAPTIVEENAAGYAPSSVLTVTGTAAPGSSVTVYDTANVWGYVGGKALGTTTADPVTGEYSFTTNNLPFGSNQFSVAASQYGFSSVASATTSVFVDTRPSVIFSSAPQTSDTATIVVGGSVADVAAGATVSIYDNGGSTPIATVPLASDDTWSANLTLTPGLNTLLATNTNLAGLTGSASLLEGYGPAPVVATNPNASATNATPAYLGQALPDGGSNPMTVSLISDAAFASGSSVAQGSSGGPLIEYVPGTITASTPATDTITYAVTDTVTGAVNDVTQTVSLSPASLSIVSPLPGGNLNATHLVSDAHGDLFGVESPTIQYDANYVGHVTAPAAVFELAAGSSNVTTVTTFGTDANGNAIQPVGNLVVDAAGDVFGETNTGGTANDGTVFEIAAGSNNVTTLVNFTGANGGNPQAGLTTDAAGDLFGVTTTGGANGFGTVFEIKAGTASLTTLTSFSGTFQSLGSTGVTADQAGDLYGISWSGAALPNGGVNASVYEIAAGSGAATTLASLNTLQLGLPIPLTQPLTVDAQGNLFGVGLSGGPAGQVWELPAGSGTPTLLATGSFSSVMEVSSGLLEDAAGNLFGVTTGPSYVNSVGNVYEIKAGSGVMSVVASFHTPYASNALPNGFIPMDLYADANGNLFGRVETDNSSSAIFEITNSGFVSHTLDAPSIAQDFGGISETGLITVTGTATAGCAVTIYDGWTALGNAQTDPSTGAYSFTLTNPLAAGAHSIAVGESNNAGYNSALSAATSVTVDLLKPQLAITSSGGTASAAVQSIAGTVNLADAGQSVTLVNTANGVMLGAAAVDPATGDWTANVILPNGTTSIAAQASNGNGTSTSNSIAETYQGTSLTISPSVLASLTAPIDVSQLGYTALDITGSGSLSGLGTNITGFTSLVVDSGATLTITGSDNTLPSGTTIGGGGSLVIASGATLTAGVLDAISILTNPQVIVDGTLKVSNSDPLIVKGELTSDTNHTGLTTIDGGGELELDGKVDASQTIQFLDGAGTLILNDPAEFLGALAGLQAGDVIDFGTLAPGSIAGISLATPGEIVLNLANGGSYSLKLASGSNLQTVDLSLQPDGTGGTEIVASGRIAPPDYGPTVAYGTYTATVGALIDLTDEINHLITPGAVGDSETIRSFDANLLQNGQGRWVYTVPNMASDNVVFSVTDQAGRSAVGQVSVTISPASGGGNAADPGPVVAFGSGTVTAGSVTDLTDAIDHLITPGLPGDSETVTSLDTNLAQNNLGRWIYTAPNSASDNVVFRVTDQNGASALGMIAETIAPAQSNGGSQGNDGGSPSGDGSSLTFSVYDAHFTQAAGDDTALTITDTVGGSGASAAAFFSLNDGNNTLILGGSYDHVALGSGHNTVSSSGGNLILTTTGGDDVTAGGYYNVITTGAGNSTIQGGIGYDSVTVAGGDNIIAVDGNQNLIQAGSGNDTVTLGTGWDNMVTAGSGTVTVSGGYANTYVAGAGEIVVSDFNAQYGDKLDLTNLETTLGVTASAFSGHTDLADLSALDVYVTPTGGPATLIAVLHDAGSGATLAGLIAGHSVAA